MLAMIFCGDALAQQDSSYRIKSVVIDAGHGGKDPGALGKISKEKNLTLKIATKLGGYIEKLLPGVEVKYTRSTDVFLSLAERAEYTNKEMPDVFMSIHINSNKSRKMKGFTTYVNGYSKDNDNLEIQKKENGGEDIKDEDIISMRNVQSNNHDNSEMLANIIQKEFARTGWFKSSGTKDMGVKYANFAVLWRANMPAVLIECGFISNPEEERFLNDEENQAYIASAIFRAFREYKNEVESKGSKTVVTQPAEKLTEKTENTDTKQTNTAKEDTNPSGATTAQAETTTPPAKTDSNKNAAAKTDNKVFFRVQIKSSPKKIPLNSREFKGLKNIEEILIDGVYKYTIGKTQNYQEIIQKQTEVRKTIKDAFVIATKDNKKMDLKDARKELGQ